MDRLKNVANSMVKWLTHKRPFLAGSYLEYLLIFIIFLSATIIYTDFVVFDITSRVFTSYEGDGTGGLMWYNAMQPGLSVFLSHSDVVNYPYGEAIGGAGLATYMAVWIPLRVISHVVGPIAGINILMLIAFCSAAISMYWLVKRLTKNVPVSLFAGYTSAFLPYAIIKSMNHITYLFSVVFVFVVAAFIGLWKKPSWSRSIILGLAIGLSFYVDGYYILLSAVLVAGLALGGLLWSVLTRMSFGKIILRVKHLFYAAFIVLVVASPLAFMQLSQGGEIKESLEGRRSDFAHEIKLYRSHVVDFIIPPYMHPVLEDVPIFQQINDFKNERSNRGENTNYLSFTVLVLIAIGGTLLFIWLIKGLKRKFKYDEFDAYNIKNFMLVGCIVVTTLPLILSFMFSPEIIVAGVRIPLPGELFITHDITLWRVMSRFFVPLQVLATLFAALSLWVIFSSSQLLRKQTSRRRTIIEWIIVVLLLIVFVAETATTVHRPSFDFDRYQGVYEWLGKQNNIETLAELPLVDPLDNKTASYVTAQVVHGKNLINYKEYTGARLTNVLGGIENPETVQFILERQADAVMTRQTEGCKPLEWANLAYKHYNGMDSEKRKKYLCLYWINNDVTHTDDIYIEYGEGFQYRPNMDNQDEVIFENYTGELNFMKADYSTEENNSLVGVAMNLSSSSTISDEFEWHITQDGKTLSSGSAERENQISFQALQNRPIKIEIKSSDKVSVPPETIKLSNVVATEITN
ncbi:hypothetical protein FJZ39_03640 [Candidatus Saccharibacteria bacterium]|nr:hypothetical protein [Candidatus Saccharibacteria bacterium]